MSYYKYSNTHVVCRLTENTSIQPIYRLKKIYKFLPAWSVYVILCSNNAVYYLFMYIVQLITFSWFKNAMDCNRSVYVPNMKMIFLMNIFTRLYLSCYLCITSSTPSNPSAKSKVYHTHTITTTCNDSVYSRYVPKIILEIQRTNLLETHCIAIYLILISIHINIFHILQTKKIVVIQIDIYI